MILRRLLRTRLSNSYQTTNSLFFSPRPQHQPRLRFKSSPSTPPSSPSTTTHSSAQQTRLTSLNARLPRFLHKYTSALATAPLSHITAFLLLHEISAVLPLLGLAATFHYTGWLPRWWSEGEWVQSGVRRFGRWFERRGWIAKGEGESAERQLQSASVAGGGESGEGAERGNVLEGKQRGVRLVVEFATAYALVKMLLVPRIVFCVWATPAFARSTVVPALGLLRRR